MLLLLSLLVLLLHLIIAIIIVNNTNDKMQCDVDNFNSSRDVGDDDDDIDNDVADDGDDDDNGDEDNDDDNNNNNDDIDVSIIQTGTHHIAYFLVHSRANSLYFSRSVLYILAISGTSGSSGFGSQSREQIDNKTFDIVSAGDH